MLVWMWRKRNTCEQHMGVCKLLHPLWKNSMEGSQKIKNRITVQSSISTSGTLSRENKTTDSKIY